jgi:uncharacterized membrane protein YdbT with pleckstrin-like domain
MPPLELEQNQAKDAAQSATDQPAIHPSKKPDKDGYYRLGHTTLYYLLFKYGFPSVILFLVELIFLGAAAGGNVLPPFSEWVSANTTVAAIVRIVAGILPIAILIAIVVALVLAYGWYYSFRYKIEDNDISFENGLIDIQEISVPFRQIQNVDIEQSVLYRIFSLANLVILTAGHEDPMHGKKNESEILMQALNVQEARRLQQYLLDRANVQKVVTVSPSIEPVEPPPFA